MIEVYERWRDEMTKHYESIAVVYVDNKYIRVLQSGKTCTAIDEATNELYLVMQLNAPHNPGENCFWVTEKTKSSELYKKLLSEGFIEVSSRHLSLPGTFATAVRLKKMDEV